MVSIAREARSWGSGASVRMRFDAEKGRTLPFAQQHAKRLRPLLVQTDAARRTVRAGGVYQGQDTTVAQPPSRLLLPSTTFHPQPRASAHLDPGGLHQQL
jgi:hypothetical protein